MASFFLFTFSTLIVCELIFVFENSQNSFSCDPPLDPFRSVTFNLNFEQKLPIWTVDHTFIESKHLKVT